MEMDELDRLGAKAFRRLVVHNASYFIYIYENKGVYVST